MHCVVCVRNYYFGIVLDFDAQKARRFQNLNWWAGNLSLIFPLGVFAFFDIIGIAFMRGIGGFFLLFVIGPAAIILLGYLIYIVIMTIKELRK